MFYKSDDVWWKLVLEKILKVTPSVSEVDQMGGQTKVFKHTVKSDDTNCKILYKENVSMQHELFYSSFILS